MRIDTLADLAQDRGVPARRVHRRVAAVLHTDERGWFRFQRLYDLARACVRGEADLRRIVREAAQDDAAEGSRWLELQVEPSSYAPMSAASPALEIILDEAAAASRATGTESGSSRGRSGTLSTRGPSRGWRSGMRVTGRERWWGSACRTTSAVVAADFGPAFEIARHGGLALVPHGGELLGPASVVDTLTVFRPDRVGHGVRASEDPAALNRVAESGDFLRSAPAATSPRGVTTRPRSRCGPSSTPASPSPWAPMTPCCSAAGSRRSTPSLATSWVSATSSRPRWPGRAWRAVGPRRTSGRRRWPTSTRGWPADRGCVRPGILGTPIWSAPEPQGTLTAMKTALAIVPAAVILLAGCASGSGADTPTSSETGVVVDATTAPETTSSSTTTPAPTTSGATAANTPTAVPTTFTDVNQTINDPDLKYSITAKRIARPLPWPAGYRASAQAYEPVGVEMTWTPSKDYTILIRKQDFSINTGSQFPNTVDPIVNDAVKAAGWTLLPDQVDKGDAVTGWLVFKVDPRSAPKMVLDYARPAVQVSGSRTSFPAKTFTVGLVSAS